MDFTDRRNARYTTRQQAVGSVKPNPPTAVLQGSSGDPAGLPKPPSTVVQKTDLSTRKRGAEAEQGSDSSSCTKHSREVETRKDKTTEASKETSDPQRRSRRGVEQSREKETSERTAITQSSNSNIPSWLRSDFELPVMQTELVNLAVEINRSTPRLRNLHLTDPRIR